MWLCIRFYGLLLFVAECQVDSLFRVDRCEKEIIFQKHYKDILQSWGVIKFGKKKETHNLLISANTLLLHH